MIRHLATALSLCLATALPLLAESARPSPVRGEILTGWQQADGTRIAALRLTLAPGWKTYWRSPGDAGIPPTFDWKGSTNLRGVGITWPTPLVFDQNGMRSIGYKHVLVLPLTIAPRETGKPVTLKADIDIGVCDDICVPARLRLTATLDTTSRTPTPAIAAALAARPYAAAEAGVSGASCALRPLTDGMEIEARLTMPSAGGHEVVVIEPGQLGIWMSETETRRNGGLLTATGEMSSIDGKAMAIDRSAIRITVLGKNHAVEITGCTPG